MLSFDREEGGDDDGEDEDAVAGGRNKGFASGASIFGVVFCGCDCGCCCCTDSWSVVSVVMFLVSVSIVLPMCCLSATLREISDESEIRNDTNKDENSRQRK